MTFLDLALLLLLSNAVQNAMVGDDTSMIGGIVATSVLFLMNFFITKISRRWPSFRHLIEGDPVLLILHGRVVQSHIKRFDLDEQILAEAIREHGLAEINEVEMAVLEIDGSISIIPAKDSTTKKTNTIFGLEKKIEFLLTYLHNPFCFTRIIINELPFLVQRRGNSGANLKRHRGHNGHITF